MPETIAMPEVGDIAPAIDEAVTQGGRFTLAEQAGKWVVVYFYPRANTPG
jgi:peroxiredoxin Q/BCP